MGTKRTIAVLSLVLAVGGALFPVNVNGRVGGVDCTHSGTTNDRCSTNSLCNLTLTKCKVLANHPKINVCTDAQGDEVCSSQYCGGVQRQAFVNSECSMPPE
jgi:hypothetical protein